MTSHPTCHPRFLHSVAAALAAAAFLNGCAGSGPAGTRADVSIAPASEEVWRALATPRPEPLSGAPRISVGQVELNGGEAWGLETPLPLEIAFSELLATNLLRRRDVHFVERRRFAAATEAARRGTLPRGAPPLGVSQTPDYIFAVTWSTFGLPGGTLEMRLLDPQSGAVVHSWRAEAPAGADPVGLARTAVGSLLDELRSMGRGVAWADPLGEVASRTFTPADVAPEALDAFLAGLAAEERWDWERARVGYQAALEADPDFVEAKVALARTARLRLGGTLAAS